MPGMIERVHSYKPAEIAERRARVPLAELERRVAGTAPPDRGFAAAIRRRLATGGYALVAEIKKASPSGGLIREDFAPDRLATAYERGGATCLSVLTDAPSFQGSPDHLRAARDATALPVLPKDFMIDPYQVLEARLWGADCVLVVLSLVDDALARELHRTAAELGLDTVTEVHDERELDRALALPGTLLGINHRDMRTFTTDLATSCRMAPLVPPDRVVIGESGLHTPDDLARLADAGIRAFWVGESLLREADVERATRDLLHLAPGDRAVP